MDKELRVRESKRAGTPSIPGKWGRAEPQYGKNDLCPSPSPSSLTLPAQRVVIGAGGLRGCGFE